jgi:hypothetical protein
MDLASALNNEIRKIAIFQFGISLIQEERRFLVNKASILA